MEISKPKIEIIVELSVRFQKIFFTKVFQKFYEVIA